MDIGQLAGVIFTSANAIRFLKQRADEQQDGAAEKVLTKLQHGELPYFVVGEKTAEVGREMLNQESTLIGPEASQSGLAEALLKSGALNAGETYLLPCAQGAAHILRNQLGAVDIRVIQSSIYNSEPLRGGVHGLIKQLDADIGNGVIPWLLFYAPSQVKAVIAEVNIASRFGEKKILLGAIGETTAAEIEKQFGKPSELIAADTSDAGFLESLEEYTKSC
jgi:uroporphyrinogen-III synthase